MTHNKPPRPDNGVPRKRRLSYSPIIGGWGAIFALLLAGCGGGGSGNSSVPGIPTQGSGGIVGKVVDVDGNPVPGAQVSVNGQTATTLGQGGYSVSNVRAGIETVTAQVTENGVMYTGSTQTIVSQNAVVSNTNIAVSPDSQQAAISGTVRDGAGRALAGAQVLLGVLLAPSSSPSAGDGSVASLVAYSDTNGHYQLSHIPAPARLFTVAASLSGYANSITTVNSLQVGETRGLDFTLSFGGSGSSVPTNVQAFSFTQPAAAQRPFVAGQKTPDTSAAYEQIRRALSPAYAARAAKCRPAAQSVKRRAQASGPNGSYTVEADVFFDNAQSDSVTGFRVYSETNGGSLSPYDFLQDPLANIYVDVDPAYVANQTYSFAVSAVGTGGTESGLSNTSSVVPLDLLTLQAPQSGQTLGNPVTVAWNGVAGVSDYSVFVYSTFPGPGVVGTPYDAGGATQLTLPGLGSGQYYLAVAGASADGSTATISQIISFRVP